MAPWTEEHTADRPGGDGEVGTLTRRRGRLAMLAWALWLAQALLRWLKWGWGCFSEGGVWRPRQKKGPPPPPRMAPGAAAP